jgi:hypothetical protein
MTSDREHEEGGRGSSAPPPYERGGESTPTPPPPYELGEYQAEEPHPYAGMIGDDEDDEEDEDRSLILRAIHASDVCIMLVLKQLFKKPFKKESEVIALFDYLLIESSLIFLTYFEDRVRGKHTRIFRKKIQAYITHYTATPPESPVLAGLLEKMKTFLKIGHGMYETITYTDGVRCVHGEGLAQPFDKHEMMNKIGSYLIKGPDTNTLSAANFRLYKEEGSINPTPCRKVHYGHIILDIQRWSEIMET